MKFNLALIISGISFASALHVPISFSEEAGLQRQIVDTSRGWLSHYIYGESSESLDKATPVEVSDNAWDVLKNDPKKFSKVCDTLLPLYVMINKTHHSSLLFWRSSPHPL